MYSPARGKDRCGRGSPGGAAHFSGQVKREYQVEGTRVYVQMEGARRQAGIGVQRGKAGVESTNSFGKGKEQPKVYVKFKPTNSRG